MSRNTLAMAVAVTFLLLAPLAGAKWMSFGTYEPDTTYDTSVYMVQDAPGAALNTTIYFNAFIKSACLVTPPLNPGTGVTGCPMNPNSGDLETHNDVFSPRGRSWQVIMGVWTDCNGDGFIGLAETAAMEYHARVLTTPLSSVGTSRCQPVTGTLTQYASKGMPNNYNNWVTEFIAIGGVDYERGSDHRVFFDRDAMVWAEPGIPDAPIGAPPPPATCKGSFRGPANNQDQGDAHTLGGILWVQDCQGNARIGATNAIGPGGIIPAQPGVPFSFVKTFNQVDGAAGTGLGFGNDPKNSTSALNVKIGSENADNGGVIVKAQDCGSGHYGPDKGSTGDPETFNTRSLGLPDQADDLDDLTLLRPVPANPVNTNPSTWSVPATLNYTYESAPETPGTGGGPTNERDCNFDNDPGYDFYGGNCGGCVTGTPGLEGNPIVGQQSGKVTATTNLRFSTNQRGSAPGNAIAGGAGGADPNLGLPINAAECTSSSCEMTQWLTGANLAPQTLPGYFVRTSINDPANTGLPASPYVTFYGYVGATTKGRSWTFPNAAEKYGNGANSCNGATSGTVNNWQCDSTQWYKTADGQDATALPLWCIERPCQGFGSADISVPLARVHQEYTFRDVDCYDGRIGNTGLGTSPSFFGTPCTRPEPAEE